VFLILLALPLAASAQSPAPDPFERVKFLAGRWEGTSEGQPGKGTVRRESERALEGVFIRVENRSGDPARGEP